MKTLCLVLMTLPILGTVFEPPAEIHSVQLTDWPADRGGNGHIYEAVESPAGITWNDAEVYATAHGGYLATITSPEENAFVFKLVDDADFWLESPHGDSLGPWLGGTKSPGFTQPGEGWEWGHNEGPFTYTNWNQRKPDNEGGHKNHLSFYAQGKGQREPGWTDQASSTLLHGFVVEYDANPLPQSLGHVALFAVCMTGLAVGGCLLFLLLRKRSKGEAVEK